jgi:GNAT superfamily N-acetyltransferase
MSDIIVRKATLEDHPILRDFELAIIEAERPYGDTLAEGPNVTYYDLKELILSDQALVLVAEVSGKIVSSGYAKIRESKPFYTHKLYSYLGFMYTLPEYRGKGINKMIIDELIIWSKEQGLTEVRLQVYLHNEPAMQAYRKSGFLDNILEMRQSI